MTFKEALLQDFWFHVGGLIAVSIGVFAWYQTNQMSHDPTSTELLFMVGGLAAMGVKIINGSASLLRNAVSIAKAQPAVVPDPKAAA